MQIKYNASVKTPAGWRHVYIIASATQVSAGMVVVDSVVEIDGEMPSKHQSRTGAKRQAFDGLYFASIQIGLKKRLSACQLIS